jgi:hypothetical protein
MPPSTISDEQRLLNQQLHAERPDFGSRGGAGHQGVIKAVARYQQLGAITSVLDYGTGKGAFPKALKQALPELKVGAYDPAVEAFSAKPKRAFDLVTCFDVLEHVERGSVAAVLEEINSLSAKLVFLQIDLQPAVKRLASGRNAHIMLAPPDWWMAQVSVHFPVMGSYPILHQSGTLQKLAIVAATTAQHGPLTWSLLTKLQASPMVIQGGYLAADETAKAAKQGKAGKQKLA